MTRLSTVGTMLVDEPAPTPPVSNSVLNISAAVLTGASVEAAQTRPGNEVAPSQLNLRGSASMFGRCIIAWLGRLREMPPITLPSRARPHIHVVGGDDAGGLRHVLHHDGRIAGQFLGQVFRQQPRADVVVVADLVADDHLDLPALVEFLGALRVGAEQDSSERSAPTRGADPKRIRFHDAPPLFRGALLRQRRGLLVVALLAREQRLQADQTVVVIEREDMLLARRQRILALEHAQHIAHRIGRREQRHRRECRGDDAGSFQIRQAARLGAGRLRQASPCAAPGFRGAPA